MLKLAQFWQIVSAIAAVFAVGVTVVLFVISQQEGAKGLEATILSKTSLLNPDAGNTWTNFEILYNGERVDNISIIKVQIKNSGSQTIRSTDFESPIEIYLEGVQKIISADVIEKNPENLPLSVFHSDESVTIPGILMNEDDYFVVEIGSILSAQKNADIKEIRTRVAGIKEIVIEKQIPVERVESDFMYFLAAFIVSIFMILNTFFTYYRFRRVR